MKALLLFALVALAPCRAPSQDITDSMAVLQIKEPQLADSAWRFDLACSGATPRDSFPLARVHWFVGDLITHSVHHNLIGYWSGPDTILVDLRFTNDFTTIAHELLHYLRQKGGHPRVPFLVPCKLVNEDEVDK